MLEFNIILLSSIVFIFVKTCPSTFIPRIKIKIFRFPTLVTVTCIPVPSNPIPIKLPQVTNNFFLKGNLDVTIEIIIAIMLTIKVNKLNIALINP